MSRQHLFTSESVSEGHPDKLADQISDAILDAMLAQDSKSRVACETMVTTDLVVIAGEITTKAKVDLVGVARKTMVDIGYTDAATGIDGNTCKVLLALDKQSPDIAMGIDDSPDKEQGAGDQGMMFGYATNESSDLMPLPISLSHHLVHRQAEVRKAGILPYLRPDAKSQVTVRYEDDKPVSVDTVVLSTQHGPEVEQTQLHEDIKTHVIVPVLEEYPDYFIDQNAVNYHINPTGRFEIGGPNGDCGLTGRRILVDTYGGMGRHGGGAFSGKDPSKVDRSAAYAARYVAKNIVAAGLADRCEVQLAYAIGVAEPVSINVRVDTFGTETVDATKIEDGVRAVFPLKPGEIISHFDLLRPIYQTSAAYGHFGRDEFPWEKIDKVDELKSAVGA